MDHIGQAGIQLHQRVVAVQPWALLLGQNGHVCVAIKRIETLNPYARRAPHHLSDGYGLTSTSSPIRMHIAIVDRAEYQDIPEPLIRQAKAYVQLFSSSYDLMSPGASPDSLGSYLTWTTEHLQFAGHSECFNLNRVPPVHGSSFPVGPPSDYDEVVKGLQDRLLLFLDHIRTIIGLTGHKEHYHISIRRAP